MSCKTRFYPTKVSCKTGLLLTVLFLFSTSSNAQTSFTIKDSIEFGSLDAAANQIESMPHSTKITVHINSSGGAFDTAVRFAEAIRKKPTKCIVEGTAGSAAYLVLLACSDRYYVKGATVVPHWIVLQHSYPPNARIVSEMGLETLYKQGVWDGIGMSVTGMSYEDYQDFRDTYVPIPLHLINLRTPNKWITELP